MKLRYALLILLFALTLTDRGVFLHQALHSRDFGIRAAISREGLIITSVPETDARGRELPFHRGGVRVGDRLDAIYDEAGEGGPIHSLADFGDRLRMLGKSGSAVAIIERLDASGQSRQLRVEVLAPPTGQRSFVDWLLEFGFQLWVPLLAALAAGLIGLLKPRDDHAFLASLMFFAFAGIFLESTYRYPSPWREISLLLRDAARYFMGYLVMLFFLRFPSPSPIDRRWPWLKKAALAPALVFFIFGTARDLAATVSFDAFVRVSDITAKTGVRFLQQTVEFPLTALLITLGVTSLALNTATAPSAADRRRLHLLLLGACFGLFPLFFLALLNYFGLPHPTWYSIVVTVLVGLFPLSFIYAVARHRVFGIKLILRRGLRYALVSRGFLVAEGLVIFVVLQWAVFPVLVRMTALPGNMAPVVAAVGALGLVFGVRRFNRYVSPKIDRHFFRDAYDTQKILTDLSRAARRSVSRPDRLLEEVAEQISRALHPRTVSVLLTDEPWSFLERDNGNGFSGQARFHPFLHREEGRGEPQASGGASPRLSPHLRHLLLPSPFDLDGETGGTQRPLQLDETTLGRYQSRGREIPEAWSLLYGSLGARLLVPVAASGHLLGFFCLGEKLSEEPYSLEDRQLLMTVAEQVAIALDYSRLVGQAAEQEKLRREMEIAGQVQRQLLPQEFPQLRTLAYTGQCRPAQGVGGDYFDFLKLDDHRLAIALGDISGKGLSAALLMASLQGALRSYAAVHGTDITSLVSSLNRLMCASTDPGKFATFFYALYDDRERTLTYVNAGHPAPIVLRESRGNGQPAFERLASTGMVLGILPDTRYGASTVQLAPGDGLLIFSDGVTEAESPAGDLFEEERLLETLRNLADQEETTLSRHLDEKLAAFVADAPQTDDITTIVARVH